MRFNVVAASKDARVDDNYDTNGRIYDLRGSCAMDILITLLSLFFFFFTEIYSISVINSFCILHCIQEENNFYARIPSFIESILFL